MVDKALVNQACLTRWPICSLLVFGGPFSVGLLSRPGVEKNGGIVFSSLRLVEMIRRQLVSHPSPPFPALSPKFSRIVAQSALPCRTSLGRRESLTLFASVFASAFLALEPNTLKFDLYPRVSAAEEDEFQQEEERVIQIFQKASPSVVFIKDLEIPKNSTNSSDQISTADDDDNAKVEGTGSGFIWDEMGHIVTNYHVIAKLATDTRGLQRCKVFLVDSDGSSFARQGKLIGFDPSYDLAVLKVDVDGHKLKPAVIGTSSDLHVGQSCFAIGNPYGYENTLTTGVVSGLGREIPSPNGGAIRGAIQTDASINSGNSGGPLIDSYGHVIGVNTATFTRKGSGLSSGINFAIPVDTVVRTVPYLIVNGTPFRDRF
ncbi:hypothetical protein H6P81_019511 [Aristolochia fimbriata]|uniref:Protease Do-like 5, chloroplastic n=1 Tax=Aristolochia fimbriata TaxID=158543 RepID=A0AAV7DUZ8_ARIFI|nr:hypothetical protein H6P81_019511 [Aristolochia fimbriata]